jgi:hypothetical protein
MTLEQACRSLPELYRALQAARAAGENDTIGLAAVEAAIAVVQRAQKEPGRTSAELAIRFPVS